MKFAQHHPKIGAGILTTARVPDLLPDPVPVSVPEEDTRPAAAAGEIDAVEAELIDRWNALPDVVHIQAFTRRRRQALRARLKDHTFRERWRDAVDRVGESSFLRGSKGWRASIDWFLKPDTLVTILEGKFDDRSNRMSHDGVRRFLAGDDQA